MTTGTTTPVPSTITGTITSACIDIAGAQWLSQYNLITIGDLDTSSNVEYRTLVCGNYVGQSSANFGTQRTQGSLNPTLEIQYNIRSGSTMNIDVGSLTSALGTVKQTSTIQYSLNGRLFNISGGNDGASAYVDSNLHTKCSQVTNDLQSFSQYLSQLTPNNDVTVPTSQPGLLNFQVNNVNQDGLAIFNLSCNDALNNAQVQQIQINNKVNAKMVVINLSGQTCSFQQGNMVGSWLTGLVGRSQTIWNVYEQPINQNTPMYIQQNLMGALLAPYYSVQTSSNIDGAAAVYQMIARAELHQPGLNFPTCVQPQTPTTTPLSAITGALAIAATPTPTTTAPLSTTGTPPSTQTTPPKTTVPLSTTTTPLSTTGTPTVTQTTPPTTTVPLSTTGAPSPSTTPSSTTTAALLPTTTTMNYCIEENGMNQPLTIQPNQVASNQLFAQTTPPTGNINPTTSTPGLNFPSTSPLINITLVQPATLTLIYLPTDRPNQPTNVEQFALLFFYPNGTTSDEFISQTPFSSGTTTTTPTTPSEVVPPSAVSPQVDLPPNFQVPNGTILMIMITSTQNYDSPRGVSIHISSPIPLKCTLHILISHFIPASLRRLSQ
jgi:choice-of-anchor A domain-containing protein